MMRDMVRALRIGEVAKICGVHKNTVIGWFDSGELKGHRLPNGLRERRIPQENLFAFQKRHGMPLRDLENSSVIKILVITQNQPLFRAFKRKLPKDKELRFKVEMTASVLWAGAKFRELFPGFVVVDFDIGEEKALELCQDLRRMAGSLGTLVFAVLPEESPVRFARSSVTETLRCPFEPEDLIKRICQLSGVVVEP